MTAYSNGGNMYVSFFFNIRLVLSAVTVVVYAYMNKGMKNIKDKNNN